MSEATQGVHREEGAVPDPDDPRKPDSPTDLSKRSWFYVGRKTFREFLDDQCTDLAAALTYYSVLSIFPAAIALMSVLGLIGQADRTVSTVRDVLEPLGVSESTLGTIENTLTEVSQVEGAGLLLILGLLGALWTASGYVAAFGRAMNRIYEVGEGRPIWKLRPIQVLITIVIIVLLAAAILILAISGPLAESIGDLIGLGDTAVTAWGIAKWPVLAFVVVLVVALLYYATPNVKQPKFRWLSLGAVVAIVTWIVATIGFSFYVANFSSYNKTYGSLAGVVVALLFLWISNLALLLGAELDAELERGRQLQAGIAAERELQLPARDTRGLEKARKKQAKDEELGRRIREQASEVWPPRQDDQVSSHT
ncbi:MAG: YihY/virulence factor BrkB family protein [Nocardioides sp.]